MKKIKNLYYTLLNLFFYTVGDIACRIPTEWGYFIYQNSMKKSIEYDDLSGAGFWKKP
jgi:hypothetical protein